MIFDTKKEDYHHKARVAIGGHTMDSSMYNTYAIVIQTMMIRMLLTTAINEGLKVMTSDIGKTNIHAECDEKIYSKHGHKFGDKGGAIVNHQESPPWTCNQQKTMGYITWGHLERSWI